MNLEELAWKAFCLKGSVEAYLLHLQLEKLDKKNEDAKWKEQTDL